MWIPFLAIFSHLLVCFIIYRKIPQINFYHLMWSRHTLTRAHTHSNKWSFFDHYLCRYYWCQRCLINFMQIIHPCDFISLFWFVRSFGRSVFELRPVEMQVDLHMQISLLRFFIISSPVAAMQSSYFSHLHNMHAHASANHLTQSVQILCEAIRITKCIIWKIYLP